MEFETEPELAELLDRANAPTWVAEAARGAILTDWRASAEWSDSLALALGRRANRLLRERFGVDSKGE
jgi:hypothetical protein